MLYVHLSALRVSKKAQLATNENQHGICALHLQLIKHTHVRTSIVLNSKGGLPQS